MIQPHLRVEKVCKFCILVGDPGRVLRISEYLKDSKKVSDNRGFVVYEGSYEGVKINVVSTGIGGPSAGIVVEELIKAGAKVLIRVGSGAALKKEIDTGDPIISTGILKEESATKGYALAAYPAVPDYDALNALVSSAKESGFKHHYGITMCTDTFYSDSHNDMMEYWSNYGNVIGSEMEGSMLFTIASIKGVKAGLIFHAGLNKKRKETYKDIIGQEKARLDGERKTIMIAFMAIKKLSKEVKK